MLRRPAGDGFAVLPSRATANYDKDMYKTEIIGVVTSVLVSHRTVGAAVPSGRRGVGAAVVVAAGGSGVNGCDGVSGVPGSAGVSGSMGVSPGVVPAFDGLTLPFFRLCRWQR